MGENGMNDEILVSIIIPVYKVEHYLDRCIRSVINQTFKNLEIVIVDDGSPDSAGKVVDKWAKTDKRITVIHQKNKGLSAARNTGLDNCHGEWIAFIDSDDYVCPNYIEKMLKSALRNRVNLVISHYFEVTPDNQILNIVHNKCGIYDIESFWSLYYSGKQCNTTALTVVWNKLYRRKIFKDLRFEEKIIHEDEQVIFDVIKNAKKILIISDNLYYYRTNRKGSIIFNNSNNISSYSTIIEERTQSFINVCLLNAAANCNANLFFVAMHDYILNSSEKNKSSFYLVLKNVKKNIKFLKSKRVKIKLKLRLYVKFPKVAYKIKKVTMHIKAIKVF